MNKLQINEIHDYSFDPFTVDTGVAWAFWPVTRPPVIMFEIYSLCKSNGLYVVLHGITCQMNIFLMPFGANVLKKTGKWNQ